MYNQCGFAHHCAGHEVLPPYGLAKHCPIHESFALLFSGHRIATTSCLFSAVGKHCHEIKRKKQHKFNPLKNKYGIDPDRHKGVRLFSVLCDFYTVPYLGITKVNRSENVVRPQSH